MTKALIQGTRICQIEEDDDEFPVHEDLQWITVADNTTTQDTYVDGAVVKFVPVESNITYADRRAVAYPPIGDQLDMQYHDQLNGTTTWMDAVAKVKSDHPKPE
jgi:hypothetical protein